MEVLVICTIWNQGSHLEMHPCTGKIIKLYIYMFFLYKSMDNIKVVKIKQRFIFHRHFFILQNYRFTNLFYIYIIASLPPVQDLCRNASDQDEGSPTTHPRPWWLLYFLNVESQIAPSHDAVCKISKMHSWDVLHDGLVPGFHVIPIYLYIWFYLHVSQITITLQIINKYGIINMAI